MSTDVILAEVRRARDELAKRFNYNLRALVEHAKEQQASHGRKIVSFPSKPAKNIALMAQAPTLSR